MFQNKVVLLVGATGGLGSTAALAFAQQGAKLILAGRDMEKLQRLSRQFSAPAIQVDISNPDSISDLLTKVQVDFPKVDLVINLTGADVRKSLEAHGLDEIQRLISVNLAGAIYLTKLFLPRMEAQRGGVILHVGGFADGRLAFPFYSVDVATRAGISAFIEAMNRELRLKNSLVRLVYFSPSPADTEVERPFHGVWQEMGLRIESPSRVADELLQAASGERERYLMGGFITDVFARINAAFPRLADTLMMDRYSAILRNHFGE